MRVPLEGGAPSLVSDQIGIDDLSRDGRMAVYSKFIYDKKMVIVDTASGKQLHALEVKAEGHFPATFTPDGKAVVYPVRERGADNLWLQPLDGSPGRQITAFKREQILDFNWSRDVNVNIVTKEKAEQLTRDIPDEVTA